MTRGLFSGLVWGGMTALLIVVMASLYAPLPAPQTGQVDLVAGSEFGRPAGDRTVAPLPMDAPATLGASAPVAIDLPGPDPAPTPDDSAAPVPAPGTAAIPADPDAADPGPDPQVAADVIVLPAPATPLPDPAAQDTGLPGTTGPAEPVRPAPDAALADAMPILPGADLIPSATDTPEPLPPVAMLAPAAPDAPIVPPVAAAPPATARVSDRLPTIGAEAAIDTVPADAPQVLGALARNAQPFRNLLAQPLFSVVLRLGDAPVPVAALADLPLPVAIALTPAQSDRAPDLVAAGIEVLMMDPVLAAASDADALRARLTTLTTDLPEAVGLMLPLDAPILKNRAALDALFDAVAQTGHGVVALPQGLDAFATRAGAAAIPAAAVFRRLDANDEDAPVIARYLDRAAFEAAQTGQVVMLGDARSETLAALRDWSAGRRAKGVALAPVSAALLSATGG